MPGMARKLQTTDIATGQFQIVYLLILAFKICNQPESHQFNNMLAQIFSASRWCQAMRTHFTKLEKHKRYCVIDFFYFLRV